MSGKDGTGKTIFNAKEMLNSDLPFKIYMVTNKIKQAEHTHDYIQMWYVKSGECIHNFNGVNHRLTKGNIFVLPPNVYHSLACESNAELFGLEFSENFISESVNDNNNFLNYAYIEPFIVSTNKIKPLFPLEGSNSKTIEMLLEETLIEFENKANHYELYIKANLLKILAVITREYDKEINNEKRQILDRYKSSITQALEYIKQNYKNKIYLDDICKHVMMSPSYFSYVFKYITGRTLTGYVNYVRIAKAKELLKSDDKTISGVACEIGFSDAAYFNKVFKKEVGVSPLKFKKSL